MSERYRPTRVEDYYSDEEQEQSRPVSLHSSPRHSPYDKRMNPQHRFASNLRNNVRFHHPPEDSEEEEEIARAMHDFHLNDQYRRHSYDYDLNHHYSPRHSPRLYNSPHPSPRYFMPPPPPPPPPPHLYEDDYYLQPPVHPRFGPHPHWLEEQEYNERMMQQHSPQQPMDLPFVHRSASTRSYNNSRRPPTHRQTRRIPSLSRDMNQGGSPFENDVRHHPRPFLSRQSSTGSNHSFRKPRRANSFSGGPPHGHPGMMMDPHFNGPMIRSTPNSPQLSDSSSEDQYEQHHQRPPHLLPRRNSMPNTLGRSVSFQGFPPPPQPQMVPPPPPPVQPMMLPMIDNNALRRNASMFNLPTAGQPPNNPAGGGGDFYGVDPNLMNAATVAAAVACLNEANGPNTPGTNHAGLPSQPPPQPQQQQPQSQQQQNDMSSWLGPPPPHMNPFPNSPGNPFQNNPMMMQPPPPPMNLNMFNPMMPQPGLWNFMNPMSGPNDMWFGNEMPPPFMNDLQPPHQQQQQQQQQLSQQGSPNKEAEQQERQHVEEMQQQKQQQQPPDMMMMPPPPPHQEPMLRRGLSMLGGLLGTKKYPEYPGEFGPRGGGFQPPMDEGQSRKKAKLAQQYQKLGVIWCWRLLDSEDNRFQSFSIANQKLINKKADKPESLNGSGIMLGREKKLKGDIMIDINRGCGCSMEFKGGKQIVHHIEIKREPFAGSSIVFNGEGDGRNYM